MGEGAGGGGDLGASMGPDVTPGEDNNNVVVDQSDSAGIVLAPDGGGYVVLPARPDEVDPARTAGPPEPDDSESS